MSQSNTADPQTAGNQPSAEAIAALQSYDAGSSRASLAEWDDAVKRALPDRKTRATIEASLLAMLRQKLSRVAVEYVCSKLVLVGSDSCAPALAELLSDPSTSLAARNALEKLPGNSATRLLAQSLPKLGRVERIGALRSLGSRADAASLPIFAAGLKDRDADVAAAAATGLGQLGSAKAAKALKSVLNSGSQLLRSAAADAALACAERLLAAGRVADARSLYRALTAGQPQHVQAAATRGLAVCASPRSQNPGT